MKILEWFKDMIDAESSLSSKRFCGVIGWITSIGVIIYCTVNVILAPTIMEFFILSVVALLGVDSFTSIWKGSNRLKKSKHNKDNDYD